MLPIQIIDNYSNSHTIHVFSGIGCGGLTKCKVNFTIWLEVKIIKIHIHRISRRLKNLREEKHLTQEELADQLGISRQSIISVEHGKCLPSLPLALRIGEIFDLPLEKIFFPEDEDFLSTFPRWRGFQFPMVNVKQSDKDITITADIPGIKEEDLSIEVGDDFVDISGERKEETRKEEEEEGYLHQEVRYGSFARRVPFPTEVKADKAEAMIKDGQLQITVPKLEVEKPKVTKIKVKKA